MPFQNLSPLPCLPFKVQTSQSSLQQVVLVKLTLELVALTPSELEATGFTHRLELAAEQEPLRFTDVPAPESDFGLLLENELTPAKPRCDVIVVAEAHAPGDQPVRCFSVGLTLTASDQPRPRPRRTRLLPPGMDLLPGQRRRSWAGVVWAEANPEPGEVLLCKRLRVTGERWLKRRNWISRTLAWWVSLATLGLIRRCPWRLTRPRAIARLPLEPSFAYGGQVQVNPGEPAFRRLPRKQRRPGAEPVQGAWEPNPAGRGFVPFWYLKAVRPRRLPAPQIEDPARPFTARAAWRAMKGQVKPEASGPLAAQGMGVQPRTSPARLGHAGSWDGAWIEAGTPYPADFSPAFWNGALPDLQCRILEGDEILELTNLCPARTPGAARDARGNTVLKFQLPGLFPYVLIARQDGDLIPAPALLDTLILEPGAGRVTCLQRACIPVDPEIRDLTLLLIMPQDPRMIHIQAPSDPGGPDQEAPNGQ
jgi:hypothetical protein